jgi:hypothetical protein
MKAARLDSYSSQFFFLMACVLGAFIKIGSMEQILSDSDHR